MERPKVAALRARPDVALTIEAGETPDQARSVSIRGRACRALYDQMARIAITPSWARYFDFGAGRVPRFLQDLAEQSQHGGPRGAARSAAG